MWTQARPLTTPIRLPASPPQTAPPPPAGAPSASTCRRQSVALQEESGVTDNLSNWADDLEPWTSWHPPTFT